MISQLERIERECCVVGKAVIIQPENAIYLSRFLESFKVLVTKSNTELLKVLKNNEKAAEDALDSLVTDINELNENGFIMGVPTK